MCFDCDDTVKYQSEKTKKRYFFFEPFDPLENSSAVAYLESQDWVMAQKFHGEIHRRELFSIHEDFTCDVDGVECICYPVPSQPMSREWTEEAEREWLENEVTPQTRAWDDWYTTRLQSYERKSTPNNLIK